MLNAALKLVTTSILVSALFYCTLSTANDASDNARIKKVFHAIDRRWDAYYRSLQHSSVSQQMDYEIEFTTDPNKSAYHITTASQIEGYDKETLIFHINRQKSGSALAQEEIARIWNALRGRHESLLPIEWFKLFYNLQDPSDLRAQLRFQQLLSTMPELSVEERKILGTAGRNQFKLKQTAIRKNLKKEEEKYLKTRAAYLARHKKKLIELEKREPAHSLDKYIKDNNRIAVAEYFKKRLPWEMMQKFEINFWNHLISGIQNNTSERKILYRGSPTDQYYGSSWSLNGRKLYQSSRLIQDLIDGAASSSEVFGVPSNSTKLGKEIGFDILEKMAKHSGGMMQSGLTKGSMFISLSTREDIALQFMEDDNRKVGRDAILSAWTVQSDEIVPSMSTRWSEDEIFKLILFPDEFLTHEGSASAKRAPLYKMEKKIKDLVEANPGLKSEYRHISGYRDDFANLMFKSKENCVEHFSKINIANQ